MIREVKFLQFPSVTMQKCLLWKEGQHLYTDKLILSIVMKLLLQVRVTACDHRRSSLGPLKYLYLDTVLASFRLKSRPAEL